MAKIVIKFSTITGIHCTNNVSSCEEVTLFVVRDDSIPEIDPDCMKVMFLETVASSLPDNVTWRKNMVSRFSRLLGFGHVRTAFGQSQILHIEYNDSMDYYVRFDYGVL